MKFKVIFNTTGIMLKYISLIFLLPVISAIFYKEYLSIPPFLFAGVITAILGYLFCLNDASEKDIDNMTRAEAFGTVVSLWAMFGFVCAIPFLFFNLTPIDAVFESFSGVSTTGATVLADFSIFPKTFFIYRSLLQWFGGMGIIVLFIAVLPKFAVAGRQMFFAEAPNPTEEKMTPRVRYTASWLWSIYILLTLIQIIILKFEGMSLYDSLCVSLSTISAGGFSNRQMSCIGFESKIVWIIGFFAFISGINFILTYKVLIKGQIKQIFKNEEFKTYFFVVLVFSILIALVLFFEQNLTLNDAIRNAFFETASTVTSTGAVSFDYSLAPLRVKALLFILMLTGASAISASGGIKIMRWIYIFKFIKKELNKIVHPNAIIPVKIEGKTVNPETGFQIIVFMIFFFAISAVSTICVILIEENISVAITGSVATLSNTGPAFGSIIGPLGSYESLHCATKLIFTFNMFIGRLEIIPLLALFNKDLWTKTN